MSIRQVAETHLSVLDRVYHYYAPTEAVDSGAPYVVWGETGITELPADDGPAEWAVDGSSYYYTRTEYDGNFDALCAALAAAGIAFRPGRIAWDDATHTMIYEIAWTVEACPCAIYEVDDDGQSDASE